MAITFSLLSCTPYMLEYLCTQDAGAGDSANLDGAGAATPDLKTDSDAGTPLGLFMRNEAFGSQAVARQKLLGEGVGASGAANRTQAFCEIEMCARASDGAGWGVDANVTGANPRLTVTAAAAGGASAARMRIRLVPSPQR